jgi:hypothetical protein
VFLALQGELQLKWLPEINGSNIDYLRAFGCEQKLRKIFVVLSFYSGMEFSCQINHLKNDIRNSGAF